MTPPGVSACCVVRCPIPMRWRRPAHSCSSIAAVARSPSDCRRRERARWAASSPLRRCGAQRGQTVPRSDRPSGPRAPPRLCQPGRPLGLVVGSPEAGGSPWRPLKKKNESSPLEQSLQGLECLRGPPGTGFSMIWCLLRTVGVVLLYLSVAGRAWRCGSAVLTELLSFKAPECCAFSCSSKWLV
jgi:hypothetical protein